MRSDWLYPELWAGIEAAYPCSGDLNTAFLRDSSGKRHHGTYKNFTTGTDFLPHNGTQWLRGEADNNWIDCGNITELSAAAQPMTLTAWVYRASQTNAVAVMAARPSTGWVFLLHTDSSIRFYDGGAYRTSALIAPLGRACFVSCRATATTVQFSLDRTIEAPMAASKAAAGTTFSIMQWDNGASGKLDGLITDVRAYSRLLSDQELATLASRPHAAYEIARPKRWAGAAPSFKAAWLAGSRQTKIIGGGLR